MGTVYSPRFLQNDLKIIIASFSTKLDPMTCANMGEIVGEIEKGRAYSQENNFFEIKAGSQDWSIDRSKENHIGRKFLQILDSDWGQYCILFKNLYFVNLF